MDTVFFCSFAVVGGVLVDGEAVWLVVGGALFVSAGVVVTDEIVLSAGMPVLVRVGVPVGVEVSVEVGIAEVEVD